MSDDKSVMNKLSTLAIIGPGRVGTSIGILATRAGYPVKGNIHIYAQSKFFRALFKFQNLQTAC